MRDRLIEKIHDFFGADSMYFGVDAAALADHLLADGWIRPPCKVGDTVWIAGEYRGVYSAIVRTVFFSHSGVEMVRTTKCDIPFHDFGKVAFFTHEKAEKALAERSAK
ncbi:MAG: hypothetical protein IKJ80_00465 [Clostridia bacterium]|nr:hypothetical protein [Clostridia bacterium]